MRKRLLLIIAIAFLPALLLVLDSHREQRELARAAAENQAIAAVYQIARAQMSVIDRVTAQTEVLAEVPVVRSGTPEVCSRYMRRLQQRSKQVFANLGRWDAEGRVDCSAVPIAGELDLAGLSIVKQLLESREAVVGSYTYGPIVGGGVVPVASPILGPNGDLLGAAYISIDLRWLGEVFARAGLSASTRLTLLDQQGVVLARFPDARQGVGKPAPEAAALFRASSLRPAGGTTRLSAAPDQIYAFYHLANEAAGGMLVYAQVPESMVYAVADAQLRANLLGLLLTVAVMVGGTLLASQRLVVRPVRRLQATARRLANGDLCARAELRPGRDEVAILGHSFDQMAASLQVRDAALRQRQQQVERLNRVYAVLSNINGLILRVRQQEDLLGDACRIAVERGGFPLVWIGLLDVGGKHLATVRATGADPRVRKVLVPAVGTLPSDLPELAEVFAEGKPIVYPPPDTVPRWRAQADYAACVVLPLTRGRNIVGCMTLYIHETHVVDAMEMRLLEEMAADISHALTHLEQAERLAYVSATDLLTGLPNASRFRERLDLALQVVRREEGIVELAVMLVSLQGLRDINSVHGLHVGDKVLRDAAVRLGALLPPDGTLARLHGGVFGIILPQRPETALIMTTTQRILERFNGMFRTGDLELSVGVRIGISLWPEDGDEADVLLQHADTALSSVDAAPERFRFFIPQLQQRAEQRLALEVPLRQALARDELYLLYQPVVAVATRRLIGVEALIRWRHPEFGEISPVRFIPIAETAGMMVELGSWVMREAFRQARRWGVDGFGEFKVAVNVAASQLKHPDFLAAVDAAIDASGADPRLISLGIELTESELMDDAPLAIDLLSQLKARGLTLSIDDFGTGYSSLAYLERFPLDTLKIDIAFIRDLGRNPASGSIIQAIIALAQALKLSTVAEGVETPVQFERLAQFGCHAVQGHLFGHAMSPGAIAGMVGRTLEMP